MNRLNLLLAASLVALTAAAHADTVLNLNATVPGSSLSNSLAPTFYSTIFLNAGSYSVSVIGAGYTASNGTASVYGGWNQSKDANGNSSSTSWEERVGLNLNTQPTTFSANPNNYPYPNGDTQLFLTGNGSCGQGNCYSSAASALAAFASTPYTFKLATDQAVTFYIPDQPDAKGYYPGFGDNTGGVSLDLSVSSAPTPEPSSLILLGTGVLGAAGAIRRRFSK